MPLKLTFNFSLSAREFREAQRAFCGKYTVRPGFRAFGGAVSFAAMVPALLASAPEIHDYLLMMAGICGIVYFYYCCSLISVDLRRKWCEDEISVIVHENSVTVSQGAISTTKSWLELKGSIESENGIGIQFHGFDGPRLNVWIPVRAIGSIDEREQLLKVIAEAKDVLRKFVPLER